MPDNNGVQYTNPPQSRNEELLEDIINDQPYTAPPQSEIEEILVSIIDETPYTKLPTSRNADLLLQVKEKIEEGGGGGSPIILKATFNNNTPGIAYGEIILSASNSQYSGNYDIMWGDAIGVMSNYSKIDTLTLDVANNKTMASIKLIEFNAIPKYATRICAVQSGTIVASFNIPNAKLWTAGNYGERLYSVGVVSDIHVQYTTGGDDVRVAMTYFNEREGVDATVHAGDLTRNGTVAELEEWKTKRDTWSPNTPVYSCVGNHEAKNTSSIMYTDTSGVREYLDSDWVDETEPSFLKIINNDVYIFMSIFNNSVASSANTMLTTSDLDWLEEKLELYRNQRVFLFMHIPPKWDVAGIKVGGIYSGFGNGNGAYSYELWGGLADRTRFLNMIDHYKNVIWFSGHSHIKYEYQKLWEHLNIWQFKGGARFVHVSSLTVPRDIIDGEATDYIYAESEGAVMDVYSNVVRIRCRNFVGEKFYGLCEYLIDTTPVTIPAKSKTLVSISATKTKTSYYTDETLSTADITVTATWSDNTTSTVPNSDVVFDTQYVDISTAGTYTIGIAYTYGEDTETTSVQVTSVERPATKTLSSIVATKTTTAYTVNDTLSTADITAVATYSDTTTANIANEDLSFDTSQVDMSVAGSYPIVVSYTEDGVTATATVNITVSSGGVNPTIIIDASFVGTISAKSGAVAPTVNDSKGTVSGDYVYYTAHDASDGLGKTLYYRFLATTGIDITNKVGISAKTVSSYISSSGDVVMEYDKDATAWTKLQIEGTSTDAQMSSSHSTFSARFRASGSSTATFPVSVNARLQIGYV